MQHGKIVFEGKTKQGKEYTIRYPQAGDAEAMCSYINKLSKERTFIRFQGEQVSLKKEAKYLQEQLRKINKKKTVQLLVICDSEVVGIAGVDLRDRTESHEGVFGISLDKTFRGQGIGNTLMRLTLEEAEKNLSDLRIISLGVFGDNGLAQEMYEKFGFKEYGRLPKGSLHREEYVDHIYMYKNLT